MADQSAVLFVAGELDVRPLDPDDGVPLQQILQSDPDYFTLSFGVPPGPAEAQSLYVGLPEGKTYDDKLLLGGFSGDGSLQAVLDVIRDHPVAGQWALGLVFVTSTARRRGVGTSLYQALASWAYDRGARRFRARAPRRAPGAVAFLSRNGFVEAEGEGDDKNAVMAHDLAP
jgi:GNAT superfamily N-acetyltransferase